MANYEGKDNETDRVYRSTFLKKSLNPQNGISHQGKRMKFIDSPEDSVLGMKAIRTIEAEDFFAFILIENKNNDCFKQFNPREKRVSWA